MLRPTASLLASDRKPRQHLARARRAPSCRLLGALAMVLLCSGCRGEGEVLELTAEGAASSGTCALELIDAPAELSIARSLTSDWETGSCYELTLTNDAASALEWWILVELSPAQAVLTDSWNHVDRALGDSLSEWRGIVSSNNIEIGAGGSTVVGACFSC